MTSTRQPCPSARTDGQNVSAISVLSVPIHERKADKAKHVEATLLRAFITTLGLSASCLIAVAQGYVYTFHATNGPTALDGSYVVLSNTVSGTPTIADLLDIKLLDSYLSPRVFDVAVSTQGFSVTSFGPLGFNGSISGEADSYVPSTFVTLTGMDSTASIIASNNGFFPGNPLGEAVFGVWVAGPIPEPQSMVLGLLGLAVWLLGRPMRSYKNPEPSNHPRSFRCVIINPGTRTIWLAGFLAFVPLHLTFAQTWMSNNAPWTSWSSVASRQTGPNSWRWGEDIMDLEACQLA